MKPNKRTRRITITVPQREIRRSRIIEEGLVEIDFRGIRSPIKGLIWGKPNPAMGQKRRYETPESMEARCNEYFESCYGPVFNKNNDLVRDKDGNIVTVQIRPFTVSGLALHLGITTDNLKKYSKGCFDTIKYDTDDIDGFSDVILRARQRIEQYAETRLYDRDGSNGGRYVLDCAFRWTTQKERAEIKRMNAERKLKKEEFKLKKGLLSDDDTSITINVTRASGNKKGEDDDD